MVKFMERKVGIIDRLHQLYLDFPCFSVQFMTDKNANLVCLMSSLHLQYVI